MKAGVIILFGCMMSFGAHHLQAASYGKKVRFLVSNGAQEKARCSLCCDLIERSDALSKKRDVTTKDVALLVAQTNEHLLLKEADMRERLIASQNRNMALLAYKKFLERKKYLTTLKSLPAKKCKEALLSVLRPDFPKDFNSSRILVFYGDGLDLLFSQGGLHLNEKEVDVFKSIFSDSPLVDVFLNAMRNGDYV